MISQKPVVAVTVNHEGLRRDEVPAACEAIRQQTGLPAFDVLLDGTNGVLDALRPYIDRAT